MTTLTRSRPGVAGSTSTTVRVNAAAMVVAMVAIVWQIAAGVDYPPAPRA
jgi:hypothetical protein